MRTGELAKRAGISTSKIRFYEAQGLLPSAARLENGYRDYSEHDLQLLRFIDRAQGLGFTLRDVAKHLSTPRGGAWKAQVQARLEGKLAQLDAHMEQVRARCAMIVKLIVEVRDARATA